MYFNPIALLVLAAFFGLLILALSAGSDATRAAEAAVTVLIALGVGGFLMRNGQRMPPLNRFSIIDSLSHAGSPRNLSAENPSSSSRRLIRSRAPEITTSLFYS